MKEYAIPSINQTKKYFYALLSKKAGNATREYFSDSNLFISIVVLRFDGEFYHSAGSSTYSHQLTHGMANYLGKALTTGCGDNSGCGVKTELMDMNTLTWSSGADYPFTSS